MFNLESTRQKMKTEILGIYHVSGVHLLRYITAIFPLSKILAFFLKFVSYLDVVWKKKNLETVTLHKYLWSRISFNIYSCLVRYQVPIRSQSRFFSQFCTGLNRIKILAVNHMVHMIYNATKCLKPPAQRGKSEFSN